MDNVVEYSLKIHLLLIEWICYILFFLEFLCLFLHVVRRTVFNSGISSEDDKLSQSLQLLTSPLDASSFIVFIPSDASKRKASFDQDVNFLVGLSCDHVPSLISFLLLQMLSFAFRVLMF